jgi:hypothetical protein
VDVEAALRQVVHGRGLHSEVDDRDGAHALALGGHRVLLGRRDGGGEVHPLHLRAAEDQRELLLLPQGEVVAREDAGAHRAGRADVARDRAGVDTRDPDDAVGLEVVVERPLGAEVRDDTGGIADDVAGDPDAPRLLVLVVGPGVADVRCGLHHDLPGVRRVGQGLLVAGHAGREDDLAEGAPARAVGLTRESSPVLEDEDGGGFGAEA